LYSVRLSWPVSVYFWSLPLAIARRHPKDPAKVLAALKTVAAAWDEGKVILQLVGPLQASKDEYLTLRALDCWFDAPAHTRLFPTPLAGS
jgi:hypothetical protein